MIPMLMLMMKMHEGSQGQNWGLKDQHDMVVSHNAVHVGPFKSPLYKHLYTDMVNLCSLTRPVSTPKTVMNS